MKPCKVFWKVGKIWWQSRREEADPSTGQETVFARLCRSVAREEEVVGSWEKQGIDLITKKGLVTRSQFILAKSFLVWSGFVSLSHFSLSQFHFYTFIFTLPLSHFNFYFHTFTFTLSHSCFHTFLFALWHFNFHTFIFTILHSHSHGTRACF